MIKEENGIIVIMLDLEGTLEEINDSNIKIFMKQVDRIRKKFAASKAHIFISSYDDTAENMYGYISILKNHLLPSMELDDCYYWDGYIKTQTMEDVSAPCINTEKLDVLQQKYFNEESKIKFVGIIDDHMSQKMGMRFQTICPMVHISPSQRFLVAPAFCSLGTKTFGFPGVIEKMDTYLDAISNLTPEEVFETQQKDTPTLSSVEALDLLREAKYSELRPVFEADKVLRNGYPILSYEVFVLLSKETVSIEEKEDLIAIAKCIASRLDESQIPFLIEFLSNVNKSK